jgi:hypothetical protein
MYSSELRVRSVSSKIASPLCEDQVTSLSTSSLLFSSPKLYFFNPLYEQHSIVQQCTIPAL